MATTQTLTELPTIQYTGMDYDTVINNIKQILEDNPNWKENWTHFYSSEAGVMLIQLMAWICDNLGVRQDLLYNEMFLSTANSEISKLNLLKQIGYNTQLPVAAKVPVTVTFTSSTGKEVVLSGPETNGIREEDVSRNFLIINGKDINSNDCKYTLIKLNSDDVPEYFSPLKVRASSSVECRDDVDGNAIIAVQGTVGCKEVSSPTRDGPYFDLDADNIAYNSIRVFDIDTNEEHLCVENFLDVRVRTNKYDEAVATFIVERNSANKVRIRYPNEKLMTYNGKVLDEINPSIVGGEVKHRMYQAGHRLKIYYITTNGELGNIAPNQINVNTSTNRGSDSVEISIVNDLAGYGGKNAETLDDAKINAPLSLRTSDRAVTTEDYDIILDKSPLILKSRSFSPSNQPNEFKKYYGRNINPQEVFSFILMNKNYDNIGSNNYNYFPWFSSNKEHVLNEKYVFGGAKINGDIASKSDTYSNLEITNDVSNEDSTEEAKKFYQNATIIEPPVEFIQAIKNNSNGAKIKLAFKPTDKLFIDEVRMDSIGYDSFDKEFGEKEFSDEYSNLSRDNKKVINDNVNAICIANYNHGETYSTKIGYDSSTEEFSIYPVNCLKNGKLTVYLDDIVKVDVDLLEEMDPTENYTSYWLLLSNNPENITQVSQDAINKIKLNSSPSSKEYSILRKGIIELINEQAFATVHGATGSAKASNKILDGNHYFQNFGIAVDNEKSAFLEEDAYYCLKINDIEYAFKIGEEEYRKANSFFSNIRFGDDTEIDKIHIYRSFDKTSFMNNNSYYKISKTDNGTLLTKNNLSVGESCNGYWSYNYASLSEPTYNGSLSQITEILKYEFLANTKLDDGSNLVENENLIYVYKNGQWSTYDTDELSYFYPFVNKKNNYSASSLMEEGGTYDIYISTTYPKEDLTTERLLEDVDSNKIDSFINNNYNCLSFIEEAEKSNKAPISGVYRKKPNYTEIASIIELDDKETFIIYSPTRGPTSSLMFSENSKNDLMSLFGVSFNNKNYSDRVTGIKQVELYLNNAISAVQNSGSTNAKDTTVALLPKVGSIIFTDNDVNHYFVKNNIIRVSYKTSDEKRLEINKLENFFYSDDYNKNEIAKEDYKFISIAGVSVDTIYNEDNTYYSKINKLKSKPDVRITLEKKETNSLYSIDKEDEKNKLNIIENDKAYVETMSFSNETKTEVNINGNSSSSVSQALLSFSFDVDTESVSSSLPNIISTKIDDIDNCSGNEVLSSIHAQTKTFDNNNSVYTTDGILPANYFSITRAKSNYENKLIFSGLDKSDNGNITFWYPSLPISSSFSLDFTSDKVNIFKLYKKMFGTNKTNIELYELFPKEEMTKEYVDGEDIKKINDDSIIVTNEIDSTLSDGEYYYCPSISSPLKFIFRKLVENVITTVDNEGNTKEEKIKVSRPGDYYIDFEGSSFDNINVGNVGYRFYICKTKFSKFPDSEFYLHFVNDRTYDPRRKYKENGLLTDEDAINRYMENKKITGTEITFLKPYIRTFDIEAYIMYDPNYELNNIKAEVDDVLNKEFGLTNINNTSIGARIYVSKFYEVVTKINGVKSVVLNYFGFDAEKKNKYPTVHNFPGYLETEFYEIPCLSNLDNHGANINYSKFGI